MLMSDIERFLTVTCTSPSRFGRDALGDPRLVFDLRNGRQPRDETVRKIGVIIGGAR